MLTLPEIEQILRERAPIKPYAHQIIGAAEIVRDTNASVGRTIPRILGNFDQVGGGKSKQAIDGAQILFAVEHAIDTVLVLAPGQARTVWMNPDPIFGEIAKHGWPTVENVVEEYHIRSPRVLRSIVPGALHWVISNYEFIRVPDRLEALLEQIEGRRILLVLDEAWCIANHKSRQTKAVTAIRKMCERVVELNGTPVGDDPLDLFSQMRTLDGRILGTNFFFFRAHYAVMGGFGSSVDRHGRVKGGKEIIGWQNLEELRERVRPYVLCRQLRDCVDLPPVLDPITIDAPLSDEDWAIYRKMRDDLVVWLDANTTSTAPQAIVKTLRLAQITSGFLGGAVKVDEETFDFMNNVGLDQGPQTRELGRAKLDALLAWLATFPAPERILIWCRFRAELDRAAKAFAATRTVYRIEGGQTQEERQAAIAALTPSISVPGPIAVLGNPAAGGAGLTLVGASMAVYMSNDFNLRVRLQSQGRIDRPGQTQPIRYVDVIATGPKGQKTVDHHIVKALREKENLADWTCKTWREKLIAE